MTRKEITIGSLVLLVIFLGMLWYKYPNVERLEGWLIIGIACGVAVSAIIPLFKEIKETQNNRKSNFWNYTLLGVFIFSFIVGSWGSFKSTQGSNNREARIDSLQNVIDQTGKENKRLSIDHKDSLNKLSDKVNPKLQQTLNLLAEVDSISNTTLTRSKSIYQQLLQDKRVSDSLEEEKEVQRLLGAIDYYQLFYDNEFTLYLQVISFDQEKWKSEAKKIVTEMRTLLRSQYGNKFLKNNNILYRPWKRFDDSLRLFSIYLAGEGPIHTEEEISDLSSRLNENYICLRDNLTAYFYDEKLNHFLTDEERRKKLVNMVQTISNIKCNFDFRGNQWVDPFRNNSSR